MPQHNHTLNVAMIGNGFIARAHSNAFHQVSHFFDTPFHLHTKVVCGRNPSKLEAFARQWHWEKTSLDWESIVNRPDTHIVDIALPNALHAPIAVASTNAGNVICSGKPIALSTQT